MDLQLSGKAALVTGGNRGIGRAIALMLAGEGANVAICGRDEERLAATAAEIHALGARALQIRADLTSPEDCRRAVDATAAEFGGLQILVNNAGTNVDYVPPELVEMTDEHLLERVLGKGMAAIRCTRAAIPHMRRARWGRIVCIGGTSARAVFRRDELPASSSSLPNGLGNSIIANFVKHASEELSAEGIMINIVHPHITRTDRHARRMATKAARDGTTEAEAEAAISSKIPIGRLIEPGEVAFVVAFLVSPLASAVTGQAIAVDGGASRSIVY